MRSKTRHGGGMRGKLYYVYSSGCLLGGLLLVAVGNLTYVLASSKGFEIAISVLMGYLFLKEIPTWKTVVGFAVVIGGFVISKL